MSIPIHRSCNRIPEFLGGDREIVLSAMLIAAIFLFIIPSPARITFGISQFAFTLFAARLMRKSDPLLRKLYAKQFHYQAYYPALPTPFVRESQSLSDFIKNKLKTFQIGKVKNKLRNKAK